MINKKLYASRMSKGAIALGSLVLGLLSAASVSAATTTIQAENYSSMFGIQTQTTTDTGGGLNVGYTDKGDWLSYPAVTLPCAGTYTVSYRVASAVTGSTLTLEKAGGGTTYDAFTVPNTGGWQNWQTVTHTLTLPAGSVSFGISIPTAGGWNLNYFTVTNQCSSSTSSSSSSTATTTAKVAIAAMGKGFNLGNMFDRDSNATYAQAKAKIDAYYAKGFRNVRIPITWTESVDGSVLADPNTGIVNTGHARLAIIKQAVDYALSLNGMYVVINAHHEVALKENNRDWVLERLWSDIATIFASRSSKLLFEILNEPHLLNGGPMPAASLKNMTVKAYAKIRAVNSTRIIIIGGNQWFGENEVPSVWTDLNGVGSGNDAYVAAEFHHYMPWTFCGDGQGDFTDAWTDSNQYTPMDVMNNWANGVGKGMPVYIGEWGVAWGSRYTVMNCNSIRKWYTSFHSNYAVSRKQATAVWDDGGWFKIWNGSGWDNNLVDCIGGSCAWSSGNQLDGCY